MNDEKLQRWALAAEIVGGIAVVATLLLLVFETRSNTYSIQAQTYQSLISELNETRRALFAADMVILDSQFASEGPDALEYNDRRRLFSVRASAWSVYESAYFAYRKSALGESEWQRFTTAMCRRLAGDDAIVWNAYGQLRNTISSEFADFAENLCDWQSIKNDLDNQNRATDT